MCAAREIKCPIKLDKRWLQRSMGFNEFPPEVFGRLKFLQMPQFTFGQPKEIFYHGASLSDSWGAI